MDRLNALRARLAELHVPAALVTDPLDIAWLSGFRGSNGALLVTADDHWVVTDFRYRTQVGLEAPAWAPVFQDTGESLHAAVGRLAAGLHLDELACQANHLTWQAARRLGELLGDVDLVPHNDVLGDLRSIKSAAEIERIRAAAALADQVIAHVPHVARIGRTEREVRVGLETFMLEIGSEGTAFDIIVGGGPNSAMCHAKPGPSPLAAGDLLVIDLGCIVEGYHSDITRTFAIGHAEDRAQAIYSVVYDALQAGLAAVAPGRAGQAVDAVARDLITARGHGPDFGHGLGHGVGLEIHENPRLGPSSTDTLQTGQIVTVEPGVYVEGYGGVRLEQLCLVTADGVDVLSHAPCPPDVPVI